MCVRVLSDTQNKGGDGWQSILISTNAGAKKAHGKQRKLDCVDGYRRRVRCQHPSKGFGPFYQFWFCVLSSRGEIETDETVRQGKPFF